MPEANDVAKLFRDLMGRLTIDDYEVDNRRVQTIAKELEAYYQQPFSRIASERWDLLPRQDAAEQAQVEHGDAAQVIRYYQDTERYVFESSYFEAIHERQAEYREAYLTCRKFRVRRVLDFGGGGGGLTLYLRARGIPCDYLDIPGKTFDFAAFRFARRGLPVLQLDGLKPFPISSYDAVVALDVLEHLSDLEGALRRICGTLRPGGLLLSKSTFEAGGAHLPHNAVYQDMRALDALVKRCGLRYVGRVKTDPLSETLRRWGWSRMILAIRVSTLMKSGGNILLHQRAG